jgi:hypothetical protein
MRYKKLKILILAIISLTLIYYFIEKNDFFNTKFQELSEKEMKEFQNQNNIKEAFRNHFTDIKLRFPKQQVSKIKIFNNIPVIGTLTGKTLKKDYISDFLYELNDTLNFNWTETTWDISESEYYLRFYDNQNKIIGKLYLCVKDCGMTKSFPFCPAMKFGGLSEKGLLEINRKINDPDLWEN